MDRRRSFAREGAPRTLGVKRSLAVCASTLGKIA
jgi:hypothetical protein